MWVRNNFMSLEDYVQVNEAAKRLHVHPETVKRLCRNLEIPAKKLHHTWLIRREDLDRFAVGYNPRPGRKRKIRPKLFDLESR